MKRNTVLTSTFNNVIDLYGTLRARALKGAHPEPLRRIARGVALAIGIALCLYPYSTSYGSIDPIKNVFDLADYQLTEKQEYCHNQIAYRESRFKSDASNGSHHGYYQGKSEVLDGASDDYQFYWYWYYVAHRYGVTEYDEPDYCKALHHLRAKGWQ